MIFQHFLLGLISLGIAYLLGSIPTGFLTGKWLSNIDLREMGSGSTGATNVLRHVGKTAALMVFIVDVAKGTAPVIIARILELDDFWQVASGVLSLVGHIWPVWLNWKGGKAVATGLGLFLGLSWPVGLASLGIFGIVLSVTRFVSLASIIAAISLPLLMFFSFDTGNVSSAYLSVSFISMAMVLWRHRSNMKRLLQGTEPKIGRAG
tara:strand:+ start:6369 stop:6989 length:621 start_codon:yes stop_codon:yes gene_type:complete